MRVYWYSFNLIDVKVSCAAKNKPASTGSSFSYSFADEKPLSQEQQSQLRSKYLFDDDEEEKRLPKRNMFRSQSLIASRGKAERSNQNIVTNNEKNAIITRKYIPKTDQNSQQAREIIMKSGMEVGEIKVSCSLPPKCPISHVTKKEANFSKGTFY